MKNITRQPQTFVIGAVCAPMTQVARYLWTKKLTVPPSTIDGERGRCPNAAPYAVAGGFGVPAHERNELGSLTLAGSYPFGIGTRKWETVILNLTRHPQAFLDGMVCIG